MDYDSSTKFISSLAKFLQSLCNGYVEFDNGVHVIGHLYLSVDTGTTIDYILNEKVCKTDENSVTFVSNSFHAQPAEKPKPASKRTGKDSEKTDSKNDRNDNHGSGQTELKSTNSGTLPSSINIQNSHGAKRPLSPSQRQSSKSGRVSPRHKRSRTESLEQNLPSHMSNPASENSASSAPSPAADGLSFSAQGADASQYSEPYQQSFFHPDEENSIGDDSEHQDIKPSIDTDVTFIKEEFASSPSGAQSDSQGRDRTHEEDSSTYPYQSTPVFPGAFSGQGGFIASGSGSHRSNFGASGDRSQMFGSGQGPSHLEGGEGSGDPSVLDASYSQQASELGNTCSIYYDYPASLRPTLRDNRTHECQYCGKKFSRSRYRQDHINTHHLKTKPHTCSVCGVGFSHKTSLARHKNLMGHKTDNVFR